MKKNATRKERRKMEREQVKAERNDPLSVEEKTALCAKCGAKCCKELPISIAYDPESELFKRVTSLYVEHGCRAIVFQKMLLIKIPHVCQHLTVDSTCNIYDKRPQTCMDYDGRKDPTLFTECLWNKPVLGKGGGMTSATGYSDKAEVKLD
jgi:hypothetical protein